MSLFPPGARRRDAAAARLAARSRRARGRGVAPGAARAAHRRRSARGHAGQGAARPRWPAMADRLEHELRDEAQALRRAKASRPAAGPGHAWMRWRRSTWPSWRTTCCCSTISIGRQRLEDLASLGKELTDAHQRLQDLLSATRRPRTRVCGGSWSARRASCAPASASWRRRSRRQAAQRRARGVAQHARHQGRSRHRRASSTTCSRRATTPIWSRRWPQLGDDLRAAPDAGPEPGRASAPSASRRRTAWSPS